MAPNAPWSDLPIELIMQIISPLKFCDLFRASCVCTSFNNAVSLLFQEFKRTPWIMLNDNQPSDKNRDHRLIDKRVYRIPFDKPFSSMNVIGSSHGWVILADNKSDIHLFDPITGKHVSLPPITTMQDISHIHVGDDNIMEYSTCFGDVDADKLHESFAKVVLSCDPNEGGYIVVLVHTPRDQSEFRTEGRISYVREGDKCWSPLYGEEMLFYSDLVFHDRLLYGVTDVGGVHVWDFAAGVSPSVRVVVPEDPIYDEDSDALIKNILVNKYIIKTQQGDILIAWTKDKNYIDRVTAKIDVYKVDLEKGILIEVRNLEEYALFLGQTSSCFSTKGDSDLKPNCVYFKESGHLRVFDMKMKSFDTDASSVWSSKALIIPNFRMNSM